MALCALLLLQQLLLLPQLDEDENFRVDVQCGPLSYYLERTGVTKIDFFSLDVVSVVHRQFIRGGEGDGFIVVSVVRLGSSLSLSLSLLCMMITVNLIFFSIHGGRRAWNIMCSRRLTSARWILKSSWWSCGTVRVDLVLALVVVMIV